MIVIFLYKTVQILLAVHILLYTNITTVVAVTF